MATPLPFPGLSAALAGYGKLFGSSGSYETVSEDRPTVTAMIPALNEERTMPYALTSLAIQTVPPDRVVVVDDGSTDDTHRIVEELAEELELDVELRRHDEPMGKTVGVKEVAREAETDTLFVLDADTFLESDDYLERVIAPHAESSVASSYGTAYPTERSSKEEFYAKHVSERLSPSRAARSHVVADLESSPSGRGPLSYFAANRPIIQFRNVNYHVEQRFFGDGVMRGLGSTLFPVGCGVLYDREKLVSVFDDYEETHGDDLTNSEDIFIGFAFCDRGWRNVRIDDTYMRSAVPGFVGTLKQNYLWGAGFLQSAYYFGGLSRRYRTQRLAADGGVESVGESAGVEGVEAADRPIDETESGPVKRPMGLTVTARLIDGLYPTTLLLMLLLAYFGVLVAEIPLVLIAWEFSLYTVLGALTLSKRVDFWRNLVPFFVVRTLTMPVLTYTYLRVGKDVVTGNRNWRK